MSDMDPQAIERAAKALHGRLHVCFHDLEHNWEDCGENDRIIARSAASAALEVSGLPTQLAEAQERAERAERELTFVDRALDLAKVPTEEYSAQGGGVCAFTRAGRVDRLARERDARGPHCAVLVCSAANEPGSHWCARHQTILDDLLRDVAAARERARVAEAEVDRLRRLPRATPLSELRRDAALGPCPVCHAGSGA